MAENDQKPENRRSLVLPCRAEVPAGLPDRTIRFKISTANLASDGGIIEQDGWVFDRWLKNPVVLWGHDNSVPGVGKGTRIVPTASGPEADILFAGEAEANALAETVYRMAKNGFINACSVGFDILESRPPTEQERAQNIRWVATKVLLYEISIVNVGADADALVIARAVQAGDLRKEDAATARTALGLPALAGQIDAAIAIRAAQVSIERERDALAELRKATDEVLGLLKSLQRSSRDLASEAANAEIIDLTDPFMSCRNCGCGISYCQECGAGLKKVEQEAQIPSERKHQNTGAPISEAQRNVKSGLAETPETPEDEAWLIAELEKRLKVSTNEGSH